MSMANVNIVQRCWDAWNRHDVALVLSLLADDVVWDFTHYEPWHEPPVLSGLEAVSAMLSARMAETGPLGVRPTAYFDGGDKVLVHCWLAPPSGDGGPLQDERWASVYTVRDGRIIRAETYSDRDEARAAAGLAAPRLPAAL
jgi:ketosteroid isomerase-like protein